MNALTGTGRLLRLNLRLEKVRLPIWIMANVGMVALTLPQLIATYNTEPKRLLYATTSASSAVTRLLNSALAGPSIGDIAVVELFMLGTLLIALMNIFMMTRHTRQEEETGRYEVIGSMQVGRQASLTAALILAGLANLVTGGMILGVFLINGYDTAGSVAFSASLACVGMVFAGVAAITAQLFESTRAANSMAGLVFGLSFAVRGLGDVFGQLIPGGTGVTPNAVSWLSPLGWVTNMRPFAGTRWWVLGLFAAAIVGTIAAAYALLARRDVGAAIFAPKLGKAHAAPGLLRPFGLIWRLNRTSTIAWGISIILSGATIGAIAHEFTKLIAENEEMQQALAQLGAGTNVTNVIFSVMFMMIGVAVSGYALQILTRIRTEEVSGRLELLLSHPRSRHGWLLGYAVYALVTSAIILAATGFMTGLVYIMVSDSTTTSLRGLSLASLAYIPAVAVLMGAALVIFGKLPRVFVAVAWTMLAACLLLFQLGALLKLPQWVLDLSPFSHLMAIPPDNIALKPILIQSVIALILGAIGFILFRRRDITTS